MERSERDEENWEWIVVIEELLALLLLLLTSSRSYNGRGER